MSKSKEVIRRADSYIIVKAICPYCDTAQEVEDSDELCVDEPQECEECGKTFLYSHPEM